MELNFSTLEVVYNLFLASDFSPMRICAKLSLPQNVFLNGVAIQTLKTLLLVLTTRINIISYTKLSGLNLIIFFRSLKLIYFIL